MVLRATTPTLKLFNTSEIHVELSSKCTLKCPRCPRTELHPDGLNKELSISDFKRAFSFRDVGHVNKFVFCGDIGDPIYCTDFLEIVQYIKAFSKAKIVIVTNGSYKKTAWWEELGKLLDQHDSVTFSVDGWNQASNELYRVNSDWDSIINGISTLRKSSQCWIKWSAIYFSFNEEKMADIQEYAQSLGCNEFQSVKSSKFDGRYQVNGIDQLKPAAGLHSVGSYVTTPIVFTTTHYRGVDAISNHKAHEWAKCLRWEKEMFINVEGLVFPCPWFNSGYQENDFVEKYKDKLSIKTRSLNEILEDPIWDEFITRIQVMPLEVCRIKCRGCE